MSILRFLSTLAYVLPCLFFLCLSTNAQEIIPAGCVDRAFQLTFSGSGNPCPSGKNSVEVIDTTNNQVLGRFFVGCIADVVPNPVCCGLAVVSTEETVTVINGDTFSRRIAPIGAIQGDSAIVSLEASPVCCSWAGIVDQPTAASFAFIVNGDTLQQTPAPVGSFGPDFDIVSVEPSQVCCSWGVLSDNPGLAFIVNGDTLQQTPGQTGSFGLDFDIIALESSPVCCNWLVSVSSFANNVVLVDDNSFQRTSFSSLEAALAFRDSCIIKVNDRFPRLGPDDVSTASDSTPCAPGTVGTFTIDATFVNNSADTLSNLFFEVSALTGDNVLCNAVGGPAGEGATLAVSLAGDLVDGLLAPGESFDVKFEIGLASVNRFTFFIDLFGCNFTN